ncbi:YaaA family protein [Microbacteriaceae bacterium 4G12]
MRILLPPSETKRDGGDGAPLDVRALAFPKLNTRRRAVLKAVRELARDRDASMAALKIGPKLAAEVDRNRAVTRSPTMPAIDRYTGVLYDALNAAELPQDARRFAADRVFVHSALLGPVGALDGIPAYRLSHDSRLPGLPLRAHWSTAVAGVLDDRDDLLLDLRSEGYAGLGPAPRRSGSVYLRVVTEGADGVARALNHFNKHAKGAFTRALLEHGEDFASVEHLVAWAADAGLRLRAGAPGELELIVDGAP